MLRSDARRSRSLLIRSTAALISEVGSLAVTIDDIADRAGVSPATVYRHFGSKQGLIDGVSVDRWARAASWASGSGDPEDALADIVLTLDNFSRMVAHDARFIAIAQLTVGRTPSAIRPVRRVFDERFERLWHQARSLGQVRGTVEPDDLIDLAACLRDQRRRGPKLLMIVNGFCDPGFDIARVLASVERRRSRQRYAVPSLG